MLGSLLGLGVSGRVRRQEILQVITNAFLAQEQNGDALLLENGDEIALETSGGV